MKVKKVWNIEPQKMLETIIKIDRENGLSAPDYGASFYVGKALNIFVRFMNNI